MNARFTNPPWLSGGLLYLVRTVSVLFAVGLVASCGGSGGSGGNDNTPVDPPAGLIEVGGTVYKGPLIAATVRLYEADSEGERLNNIPIAESITDDMGQWTALVPENRGDLRVEVSGGFYYDEADTNPDPLLRRQISFGTGDSLSTVLLSSETRVVISAFSNALVQAAQRSNAPGDFEQRLAVQRAIFEDVFGVDIMSIEPIDPAFVSDDEPLDQESLQYALILGGFAYVLNEIAIDLGESEPNFEIIDAVVQDLSDCRLDGLILGDPVNFILNGSSVTLPTDMLDINTQILRYRNNNIQYFIDTPLPVVGSTLCGQITPPDDTVPPVFLQIPSDVTVNATSAAGTPRSHPTIVATLADVVATDDVTDPVIFTDNAPSVLPIGVTPVVITALDEAGNAAVVSVDITIADLQAPTIVAPDDVRVMGTGPLTTVTLGFATVSDNVSDPANILITTDAPGAGFPLGVHIVNWQAEDEVGLIDTDTQQVIVESTPPEVAATLSDLSTTEGVSINVDLSVGFSDVDSVLTYSISGLPAGTSLVLDSATGLLSGAPGRFDAEAAPLSVIASATDEVNSVSQSFTINVVNVNNPPSFTIDGTLSALEDFSGTISVTPTLDPNTPDEAGETVSYSISPDPSTISFANVTFSATSGQISMTGIPDAAGSAVFTLTADDGQPANNLYTMMVPIDVIAVNDPPVFSLSGDLILAENFPGTEVVTMTLDPMPADELAQTITYTISPTSVSFANVVVDSVAGEIRVTAVANQTGSQLFIVTADDGQPENNAYSRSFNLIVSPSVGGGDPDASILFAMSPPHAYQYQPPDEDYRSSALTPVRP